MTKNDLITLTIDSLSSDGSGVGRANGMAVFVPFTAVGDVCRVRIVKVLKSYAFGIVSELVTAGPGRIAADCPVFGRCGGCALRHLSYESELAAKRQFVLDAFTRIGGFSAEAASCLPSPEVDRYRNKAQYPFVQLPDGSVSCGFYAARSHRVISCPDCMLQPEILGELAKAICALLTDYQVPVYDEQTRKGVLRHLYLRRGAHSGQIMVCIVVNANGLSCEGELAELLTEKFPDVKTLVINSNRENTNVILGRRYRTVFGDGMIRDTLCGVPVELSAPSFYQVNTAGAEQLYRTAAEFAAPASGDLLLDLYCGTGTIGLSMARRVNRLIGVESVCEAVESARANALSMGVSNAEFFCADAGEAAARLVEEYLSPDIVVLDPPRAGCDEATRAAVIAMQPQRIVMVSCNPSTAARDTKAFALEGYRLEKLQPVDMFPRTRHVETVVLMSRVEGK